MTDEELVAFARDGDAVAEGHIITKYSPLVHSIVSKYFFLSIESEDLVQEGLVGLYSAIKNYAENGANFSTYAYTCIKNAVNDAVKKSLSKKNSALNNSVPIIEIGDALSPVSPEDELIKWENRKEFLQKISNGLSSLEFKVTVMHIEGMSVSEISKTLEKEQKSISNALSRAKQKLIKLYS